MMSKLRILCFHGYLMDAESMALTMKSIAAKLEDLAEFGMYLV